VIFLNDCRPFSHKLSSLQMVNDRQVLSRGLPAKIQTPPNADLLFFKTIDTVYSRVWTHFSYFADF
jgi:hypothetical protein